MADVFLSYSSKDRAAAERVQQALTARGIDVFWDQATPPGVDWDTWIRAKLSDCKAAIVLWSKESIKSPNVRHEAIVARDGGKLVPAMIDTFAPEDFPMGLYLVQGAQLQDWRNPESKGVAQLVREIEKRLGLEVTPEAAAPQKPEPTKAARNTRVLLLGMAGLVVAVAVGAWWIVQNSKAGDRGAATAPAGELVSTPATGDGFSQRMLGHWHWSGQPCAAGPNVTLEGGRLVFTTPENRYVHVIESDTALETHTRVIAPDFALGEQYVLTPEFFATNETRSFNLIVDNQTKSEKDTWSPCEP